MTWLEPVIVTRDSRPSCIQMFCFQENLEIITFMSTLPNICKVDTAEGCQFKTLPSFLNLGRNGAPQCPLQPNSP